MLDSTSQRKCIYLSIYVLNISLLHISLLSFHLSVVSAPLSGPLDCIAHSAFASSSAFGMGRRFHAIRARFLSPKKWVAAVNAVWEWKLRKHMRIYFVKIVRVLCTNEREWCVPCYWWRKSSFLCAVCKRVLERWNGKGGIVFLRLYGWKCKI